MISIRTRISTTRLLNVRSKNIESMPSTLSLALLFKNENNYTLYNYDDVRIKNCTHLFLKNSSFDIPLYKFSHLKFIGIHGQTVDAKTNIYINDSLLIDYKEINNYIFCPYINKALIGYIKT